MEDRCRGSQQSDREASRRLLLGNPTHPQEIAAYLKSLKEGTQAKPTLQHLPGHAACIDAVTRHEKALDMFAQAGGMPGCVTWGCIKLALEVRHFPFHG